MLALRALLTTASIFAGLVALIVSTTPRIVAAPTSVAQGPIQDAPAIAERLDGGYELMMLAPASHVVGPPRRPAGVGAARSLRVAVALVNFADEPAEPFAAGDVANTMFAANDSLASLYDEQSFGLVQVTGDVFAWFTVARGDSDCDFSGWADAAAAAIGPDALSAYTNLLVVFPETPACAWSGLAYVGGTTAWINGAATVRATAHELGHNLGLGHASSLSCTSASGPVALGAECSKADEYGDPFTLMGSGGTLHMNGIHKLQLGWLSPRNVVDVEQSGDFVLTPLGSTSGDAQVLRIGRGDSTLVIEYRQPVATFERFGGPFEPAGGVTARIADGPESAPRSLLIDSTPETATHADSALAVGRGLLDGATGIRVKTVFTSRDRAEIEVVLAGKGGSDSTRALARPTTLVVVARGGQRRTRLDLSWLPVGGGEGGSVSHYLVTRNGRIIARPRKPRLTRFERHGRHVYRVVAVSKAGARSAASPRMVVTTEPPSAAERRRAPLRGIEARPTADGRVALSTHGKTPAKVRVGSDGFVAPIPQRGTLALQLSTSRTSLVVRPSERPGPRSVRVFAVRSQPLAG